jgi:hypothetical protein
MSGVGVQRVAGFAVWTCLLAQSAAAQLPEGPYIAVDGHLTLAGEFSASVGPRDNNAFFNYTNYNHDALRTIRARLLSEFRLTPQLAVLGELRSENNDSFEAAALFLRWRPWLHREFDVQVGRIPPVIGSFGRRAYGRDNLVVGTPLAYQYLTSLRPDALPATVDDLLRMRARGWRPSYPIGSQEVAAGTPLVSGFRWDTGVQTHWQGDWLELSAALTRGAPAVPVVRETNSGLEWSGRAAVTARQGLIVGVSAARGDWVEQSVLDLLPASQRNKTSQSVVGTDVEYGRSKILVRAEWLHTAFEMPSLPTGPLSEPLGASSGFVEGRYRWHPRWQASARAERLDFSNVSGTPNQGRPTAWDAPVVRVEGALGFRAARNVELRAGLQHDWREAGRVRSRSYPTAQVLYWF